MPLKVLDLRSDLTLTLGYLTQGPSFEQLGKGQITLSNGKIAIRRKRDSKTCSFIQRIEFYPVYNTIQPSNNRGQVFMILFTERHPSTKIRIHNLKEIMSK